MYPVVCELCVWVPRLIPSWLLWVLMVTAVILWLLWWKLRVVRYFNAFDLGGLIAPLLPWALSYTYIFIDEMRGQPPDIMRSVALGRVSLAWLLVGINVLLARPLLRKWRHRHVCNGLG